MMPPSVPQPRRDERPDARPANNGGAVANTRNRQAERGNAGRSADEPERGSLYGIPIRELGATGVLNCKFWSTDVRERLDADDPLRKGFQKSPPDGSKASVERLAKLHDITLQLTTIDR